MKNTEQLISIISLLVSLISVIAGTIWRSSRDYFAKIISVLFHPLLMATYGCLLMFYGFQNTIIFYMTGAEVKWRILLIVFLFSFVFPALNILVLYKLKRVPDLSLSNRSDRTFPYVMTSLFYFGLFYLLKDVSIWGELKVLILGGGVAILITALINMKTKISAHMVGIGGLLGSVLMLSFVLKADMTVFYGVCILLAGTVAWARLKLKEHQPFQIYSGFFLGLAIQILTFFLFSKFDLL